MKSKAAVLEKVGEPFVIREIELAEPAGREVLVQVKAVGLCQTDMSIAQSAHQAPMPAVLGHEVAGVVAAVGPDVTEFAVGDHVVGCLVTHCGHCDRCRKGKLYACRHPEEARRGRDQAPRITTPEGQPVTQFFDLGGFAEFSITHENNLVAVSPEIPFDRAALLGCGVVTGAGAALKSAALQAGDNVAVIGCGGVGLSVIQGAVLAGARRIIAIDLQPAKLELAKRFGATDLVNPADGDPVERVRELTGGGVDAAFEVIGLAPTAKQALDMLTKDGTAYLIGVQKPGTVLEIDPLMTFNGGQKGIRGVSMGSTNFKVDVPYYADLYLQGRYNLDDLVSRTISLEEINDGYEELKKGEVARSVITF
ncbi:zinc-binding dehydrogenase [Microbacterium sp. No. 7]|uniref:zinc-binding dehydrogenase n=1 Tax=Microbacterium sp. No. 7 TaxID=1714373 RepID=UPI0006D2B3E3|nr:Zn-dependent alcohol dehydrogenase [Microbacterium sp. No. 7]ALJ21185.1 alcohol dehydrogenase [Microbacterium sp. No. 7]